MEVRFSQEKKDIQHLCPEIKLRVALVSLKWQEILSAFIYHLSYSLDKGRYYTTVRSFPILTFFFTWNTEEFYPMKRDKCLTEKLNSVLNCMELKYNFYSSLLIRYEIQVTCFTCGHWRSRRSQDTYLMYSPCHQVSRAPHALEVTRGQSCNWSTTQVCRRWCSRHFFATDSQELPTWCANVWFSLKPNRVALENSFFFFFYVSHTS